MSSAEVEVFENDDAGYDAWVRNHNGWVLTNTAPDTYMLHDCDCGHLTRAYAADQLTANRRMCSMSTRALMEWAERESDSKPLRCSSCM